MQSRPSSDLLAHTIAETTLAAAYEPERPRRWPAMALASAALLMLVATATQLWPA